MPGNSYLTTSKQNYSNKFFVSRPLRMDGTLITMPIAT
jgi:hypothetical protein